MTLKMIRGYKVIGWCMVLYAAINVAICVLSLLEMESIAGEADAKKLVTILMIAITAVTTLFLVLAGIAGINANFKLGTVSFIVLLVFAAISIIGSIMNKSLSYADTRTVLIPLIYAAFMYPAKKEAEENIPVRVK